MNPFVYLTQFELPKPPDFAGGHAALRDPDVNGFPLYAQVRRDLLHGNPWFSFHGRSLSIRIGKNLN